MNGIQAWVALPGDQEETEPSFSHHAELPLVEENVRLVAGEAFGVKAPVPVHSPLFYLHYRLEAAGSVGLPGEYGERAIYVAAGAIEADGRRIEQNQMAVFAPGAVRIRAPGAATLIAIGGEPVGPRFIEWNFVSSSRERIEQAKADWRAGRMKLPDLDNAEFIPLPGDSAPPNPMS
jgi:hypothetical protein